MVLSDDSFNNLKGRKDSSKFLLNFEIAFKWIKSGCSFRLFLKPRKVDDGKKTVDKQKVREKRSMFLSTVKVL